jgi:hypothetical protein
MNPRFIPLVCLTLLFHVPALAAVPVVVDGKPAAVIVIAEQPTAVARYAAEQLAQHIQRATGAQLPLVTETAAAQEGVSRIHVGNSHAVRAAGIDVTKLAPEAFVMRATGNSLFIAGDDKNDDPLDPDTRAGTLWGVYEWLDRELGVRWLWPGALGTFIPKTKTISTKEVNETIAQRFLQRRLRPGLGFTSEHPALGFTEEALKQFSHDQSVFLRRHRMGRSLNISYGHAFTDWWGKHGKEHPEWFQLREGGKRGPSKPTGRYSMCVSNPEFQQQIVEQWKGKRSTKPGVPGFINAVENDILGLCTCANCQALDGSAPPDYLTFYPPTSKVAGSRFVSDRYAKFWLGVQQRAAQIDPQATVIGYVYFNYFSAPTSGVKLNDRILLGYCPSAGWFPRSEEEHEWMKQQWAGWRKTGAQLFMRTNHLLDGYCMPFIFAHQFADEFHHAVENGMVATDFDSLTGHWATQGPTLYMAARLHTRPELSADEVLAEYYSAFGPAGAQVKQYFDYWENYTTTSRDRMKKIMEETQTSRWRNWAKAAHLVFPQECFVPADKMLAEAEKAAGSDLEAKERVKFLRRGLDHAKLCAKTSAKLSLAGPAPSKEETEAALKELLAFRRAAEKSGIGNFNHLAWLEDLSWKLSDDVKQTPDLYP